MEYYYRKDLDMPFKDALKRTKEKVEEGGFKLLSEVDFVKHLNGEEGGFRYDDYMVLGVCYPPIAKVALSDDPRSGFIFPANITVCNCNSKVSVSAILPSSRIDFSDSPTLLNLVEQFEEKLKKIIDRI